MSHAKDQPRKSSAAGDAIQETAIEGLVYRVISAEGRIVPRTEADVAEAEVALAGMHFDLPAGLTRPPAGPPPSDDTQAEPLLEKPQSAASENLARAARSGAEIPAEVQERMHDDRLRAEHEADVHD